MKPKNSDDAEPNEHKIVVQKRNTLTLGDTSDADAESKEEVSEVAKKDERRLDAHEIRLEPDETGAINAIDNAPKTEVKQNTEPTEKTPAEHPKNSPTVRAPNAKIDHNPTPEDQARMETVNELIGNKKYFVPIAHGKKSRSTTQFVITFTVVLMVGLLAINLVVDAGLIKTDITPPIQIFNK